MRGFKKTTLVLFMALVTINAQFFDGDGNIIEDDIQPEYTNTQQTSQAIPPSIMDIINQVVGVNASEGTDPLEIYREDYPLPKGYNQPLDEYDYIIVGAGSTGSVLAARLTEDPQTTVLLLEAGKPECLLTEIPMLTPIWAKSEYAWPYQTEEQPGICTGSEDNRCYWSLGKGIGGTGILDFMMYTRGRPQDWDRIAADGNYGWSYKDVLHYYIKSEKADLKFMPKNTPYHGKDGLLNVEHASSRTGLVEAFLTGGKQLGIPVVDYNAPDGFGFGYVQSTSHYGHRISAAKAYLHQHKRRQNLHILTSATVTKVDIDPSTRTAYAVEYTRNGSQYTVRCRKEIILSAGPIASPQLLMLSGVGPKEHLESIGIPVIKDLPVGRTLYDHVAFPGVVFKLNTTDTSVLMEKVLTVRNLIQWLHHGEGSMSSASIVEGFGYIKTSQSDDSELPNIGLLSLAGSIADPGAAFSKSWKIRDETFSDAFGSLKGFGTWSAIPILMQPKSKGFLELRNTNPFSHPKIYANYLIEPRDLAAMREAVKFIIKLGESEAFKKYGMQLHLAEYSQCKTEVPGSDAYWDCAIKTLLISPRHQTSTCAMGPSNDPNAVVDPELRVYGINGLRVADSSVIPRPICARTYAPAIMIGEKAADMLKRT